MWEAAVLDRRGHGQTRLCLRAGIDRPRLSCSRSCTGRSTSSTTKRRRNVADVADLASIKAQAEKLRRDADKAEGSLERLQKQLREEHGCGTLDEAEMKLKKLREQEEEAASKFKSASRKFEERWGRRLG